MIIVRVRCESHSAVAAPICRHIIAITVVFSSRRQSTAMYTLPFTRHFRADLS